jgi:hypothetical protein
MNANPAIGLFFLVCLIAAAAIFATIASKKNRNPWVWGIIGFVSVLGFIGFIILLIVLACLSTLCPKCKKSLTREQWGKRQCPRCGDISEHSTILAPQSAPLATSYHENKPSSDAKDGVDTSSHEGDTNR